MKNFFKSKLVGITLVSGSAKLFALFRDVLFASTYGTGILAASYEGASRIPMGALDILFGCAIGCSFIPILFRARCEGRGDSFSNGLAGVILLSSFIVTAIGMMLAGPLMLCFARGLSSAAFDVARSLLVLLFPTLFINSFSFFLIAELHSRGRFVLPALIGLLGNALCVIYLLLTPYGIEGLAAVSLFGAASELLLLYYCSSHAGYLCRPTLRIEKRYMKDFFFLTVQGALPCALIPIMNLISVSYADNYFDGRGISVFLYVRTIQC